MAKVKVRRMCCYHPIHFGTEKVIRIEEWEDPPLEGDTHGMCEECAAIEEKKFNDPVRGN
jgi:hypothetical protein